jgi:pimeloyl-ACP methyl ester carboxylesterase
MSTHIAGPLHSTRTGVDGQVMLFVHPNPYDGSAWMYQLTHLASWYRCAAVDLPGFGRSPKASPGITLDEIADACWDAVDAIDPDGQAILVGCSIGSPIVARMERRRSDRTAAVVISGTGHWETADYQAMLRNLIGEYEAEGVGYRLRFAHHDLSAVFRATPLGHFIVDQLLSRDQFVDIRSVQLELESLIAENTQDYYSALAAPAIILTGTEDGSHDRAIELWKRTPKLEIGILPGAGHACQLEQPWLFDRLLLEFLDRHDLGPVEVARRREAAASA